jgi:hypothetical protein
LGGQALHLWKFCAYYRKVAGRRLAVYERKPLRSHAWPPLAAAFYPKRKPFKRRSVFLRAPAALAALI